MRKTAKKKVRVKFRLDTKSDGWLRRQAAKSEMSVSQYVAQILHREFGSQP
jgi:predicted HicB family RNase H-like nuclease